MKTFWKVMIVLNVAITGCLANTTIFSALSNEGTTTNGNDSDKICIEFKNSDGYKLDILMVGLTSSRLILMTKSFYVYDIPRTNMNVSFGILHLSQKPAHLSVKYPVLWKNKRFTKIKGIIYNAFLLHSDKFDKICITTQTEKEEEYGVNYIINNQTVELGWPYIPPETDIIQEQVISTNELNKFYAIRQKKNGLYIAEYAYTPKDDGIHPMSDSVPICFKEGHKELYAESGKTCPHGFVDWPPMTGFVINKQFFLFGSHEIHQFDAKFWNERQQKVSSSINIHDYTNFFTCIGDVTPVSLTWFYVIITVIVILLMILFCILSMFIYVVVKKSKRFRKNKSNLFNISMRSNNPTSGFIGILTRKPDSSVAPSQVAPKEVVSKEIVSKDNGKAKKKKKKHSKKPRTESHF